MVSSKIKAGLAAVGVGGAIFAGLSASIALFALWSGQGTEAIVDPSTLAGSGLCEACWECEPQLAVDRSSCPALPEVFDTCSSPNLPAKTYSIEGSFDEDELDFLRHVHGMLVDNADLLEWFECELTANLAASCEYRDEHYDFRGCFTDKVTDPNLVFRRMDRSTDDCIGTMSVNFKRHPDRISICRSTGFEEWMQLWTASSSTPADRQCALMEASGSLVHELVHLCGGIGHGPDCCGVTAFARNSYMWAMTQRYPCAAEAGCCAHYVDDAVWMYGETLGSCGKKYKRSAEAGACVPPGKGSRD